MRRHRGNLRHAARRAGLPAAVLAAALVAALAVAPGARGATRVWAVGDGGTSTSGDDRLAGRVASWGIDRLLFLGDVYEKGTAAEFRDNYHPGWGRFKAITRPTPGNHEWDNRAEGYDPYWGRRARGPGGSHYYSFDLGGWHVVSLNSEEDTGESSPQVAWLRRDLARYAGTCTIAFWHSPRYSAGNHSDAEEVEPLWDTLAGRATVVLNGHDHNYQRFRRTRGITQFVAGAGGKTPLYDVNRGDSRLAAFDDSDLGALRLDLERSALGFRYMTLAGATRDSGRIGCQALRPRVAIDVPGGALLRRGARNLAGRARGYAGRLRLSLERLAPGGTCTSYDGFRFLSSPCGAGRSFGLRDPGAWRLRLPAGEGLRTGSYVFKVSARDPAGRRGSATARFTVR